MTQEEILNAIANDKMMPFIQPEQLAEIVNFVIKNYQPSLPSDLDEAAEEIAKSEIPVVAGEVLDLNGDCYETDDINWPERCGFIRGFKAGAEWMAGQGVSVDGKVIMDFSEPYDIINRRLIAKLGDALLEIEPGEVVVQIRKK